MKKILFTLFLIINFFSCKRDTEENDKNEKDHGKTTIITVIPHSFISQLPFEVSENSGLILYDDLLWTFNDSGGENKIFALKQSGEILKEIVIENSTNADWEDIAQNNSTIFIGDFGNNDGIRNDLTIYSINKTDLTSNSGVATAGLIHFDYANQKNFDYQPLSTPFDCEAIVEYDDKLYIFSKNWVDQTTTVYEVPNKEGNYTVEPDEVFNVDGLITGADISPDKKKLGLIGYKDYKPIVWICNEISKESFFQGDKTRMEFNSLIGAQTEGICFKGNDTLLISCESTVVFPQQVFYIDLNNP